MLNFRFSPALIAVFLTAVAIVLIPFFIWGEAIEHWANAMLASSESTLAMSLAVVVLLGADILLPLPSSLIALFAGAKLGLLFGSLSVFAGLMIGNLVGYFLGQRFGASFAQKVAGQSVQMPNHISAMLVCVTRTVPVLAEAVVVTAGAGRLPLRNFLPATMLGNLGFAISYCWAGQYASAQGNVLLFVVIAMIGPLLGYIGYSVFQRGKQAEQVS